jgi:uncharacterized protein YbbC (DUF1343 family)/CubicO group peptidase (beta-lactamase class C family)
MGHFRTIALILVSAALASAQARYAGSEALDKTIEAGIAAKLIPGAVCLVGRVDAAGKLEVLHKQAYGLRSEEPTRERMTVDTIFDVASVTKVAATTAAMMKLFEQGKVRMNDKVTDYLPGFQGGRSDITVRQLMTHFGGLRPDLDTKPAWSGYQTGVDKALVDVPVAEPGARMIYSDIGFLLLGEIVHKVSGKMLNEYVRDEIYAPLGMTESTFLPPASWRPRIAPTEWTDGVMLRGVVHDPTTRLMGGVAGHAGLFSTADDLAKYATMLLNLGALPDGSRLLSPLTVRKFTSPQTPPHQATLRGLGFDMDSPFSTNRGELYPIGSYGHTGFTGTSIWIDPSTRSFVILLANSVHPKHRPAITGLRGKVATVVAASLGLDAQGVNLTGFNELQPVRALGRNAEVQTGLDVLVAERFARLQGKRVGLITNQSGITRDGRRNIDAMLEAGVKLTALFSPEHGIAGKEDHENIANAKDEKSGLPVWSLYQGENRKPSAAMLRDVDVLVFDIQDAGARFYTYVSTLKKTLEAAGETKLPLYVLDRPNPITGTHVEGPLLDADTISFVGCSVMPLRHGMTLGELASLMNTEEKLGATLEVVKMKNWRRADWFDSTGLVWVNPSPNLRSLNAETLYPGVAMIEYAKNYSVGRGTDAPFEQIGADWINGPQLAAFLNKRMVPGVRFYATRFTPTASNFQAQTIDGVRLVLVDREGFSALRLGLEIINALQKLYPGKIDWAANRRLIGSAETLEALRRADDPRNLEPQLQQGIQSFLSVRARYLLYP